MVCVPQRACRAGSGHQAGQAALRKAPAPPPWAGPTSPLQVGACTTHPVPRVHVCVLVTLSLTLHISQWYRKPTLTMPTGSGATCTLAPPWDTDPTSPQTSATHPPPNLGLQPPAYWAGTAALAGEVVQTLVLQLLGDERDHGRGPVSSVRTDEHCSSGTSGPVGPGRHGVCANPHGCISVSQGSSPFPRALPALCLFIGQEKSSP